MSVKENKSNCQGFRKASPIERLGVGMGCPGGGGVTVLGGVQKIFKCYSEEYDFVGNVGGRHTIGLDDLGDLFQSWWF